MQLLSCFKDGIDDYSAGNINRSTGITNDYLNDDGNGKKVFGKMLASTRSLKEGFSVVTAAYSYYCSQLYYSVQSVFNP